MPDPGITNVTFNFSEVTSLWVIPVLGLSYSLLASSTLCIFFMLNTCIQRPIGTALNISAVTCQISKGSIARKIQFPSQLFRIGVAGKPS